MLRSAGSDLEIGHHSALLENGVAVATAEARVSIGRRTVFGHRCLVIGASVGDLSEIGNGSILLPGAHVGTGCVLGEGTLVPPGAVLPPESVAVGRPARVVRAVDNHDRARLARLREGQLDLLDVPTRALHHQPPAGAAMGQLYAFRGTLPTVHPSAVLFDSAEVTGDVVIGRDTIVGAGVKIIGDSHGPVRIGARVQILENTVLHLLPDNQLVIDDEVIIGPGAMVHGCHLGQGTIVEPGAIVCDWSEVGAASIVRAGSVVKQRDRFGDHVVVEGFAARVVDTAPERPSPPSWALRPDDLASLARLERGRVTEPRDIPS